MAWYRPHRRDLPWRRTRDPYPVWVSEVMLQQTTVEAVTPRFRHFLERFPDVEALASARERDVLAEWSGLGYYARARNLHRAAQAVVLTGGFPRTVERLKALPGVGAYTAAAVASICFGVPEPVVDGNVVRVLCRFHGLRLDPRAPATLARVRALARPLVSGGEPGDRNQALMELGALVCMPRAPRCGTCPLAMRCRARAEGAPEKYPRASKRAIATRFHLVAGVARRGGRLLLVEDEHLVPGLLTVPLFRVGRGKSPTGVLLAEWGGVAGREAAALTRIGTARHSVLNRRYLVEVFAVQEKVSSPPPRAGSSGKRRLLRTADLARHAHGGLLLKILAL